MHGLPMGQKLVTSGYQQFSLVYYAYEMINYHPVIKDCNGKCTIDRWCSHQSLDLWEISHCHVWLPEGDLFFGWSNVKHSNHSHAQWWSLWDKDHQLGILFWHKLCYSMIFVFIFFLRGCSATMQRSTLCALLCLCSSECLLYRLRTAAMLRW